MFVQDQNYSTCWIFSRDGTNDQIRSKRPRTLEEFAYANCHEWPLAQLIALVCAGLNIYVVQSTSKRLNLRVLFQAPNVLAAFVQTDPQLLQGRLLPDSGCALVRERKTFVEHSSSTVLSFSIVDFIVFINYFYNRVDFCHFSWLSVTITVNYLKETQPSTEEPGTFRYSRKRCLTCPFVAYVPLLQAPSPLLTSPIISTAQHLILFIAFNALIATSYISGNWP